MYSQKIGLYEHYVVRTRDIGEKDELLLAGHWYAMSFLPSVVFSACSYGLTRIYMASHNGFGVQAFNDDDDVLNFRA